nr:SIR2 family protein [Roseospira navarrensis]
MPKALTALLQTALAGPPCDGRPPGCTVRVASAEAQKSGSLGELSELVHLLHGPRHLCETLQIANLATLRPLASHRYLVYLVREGLIREIITTNYDTCLETAFSESLEDPAAAARQLAVVTSLEAYRTLAGCRAAPGQLLIYKINGCAREYAAVRHSCDQATAEEAARNIILTERQLQTFRQEQWAQDLLRDRARTRNLLFSGFGSAEPQVRHTVLTLMEEFADGQRVRVPDETMDLPNAPFIHVYGHTLSFYQTQILVGFLDAHSHPVRLRDHPEARIEPLFRNVFCSAGEGDTLSASTFMQTLFVTVFRALVLRATGPDQDLALWLRNQTPGAWRAWLSLPGRLLAPPRRDTGAPGPVDRADGDALLKASDTGAFPLPLWRLLHTMRFPSRPMPPDCYVPLRDEPVLVLLTMAFLAAFGGPTLSRPPFDLTVTPPPGGDDAGSQGGPRPMHVRLIEDAAIQTVFSTQGVPRGSRLIRLIAIPSRRPGVVEGRWSNVQPVGPGQPALLRIGRFAVVSAADLVRTARVPDRLPHVLFDCFGAVRPEPAARLTRLSPSGGPS